MPVHVSATDAVDFLFTGVALKGVVRQGWILKGISNPESVADHTAGCCLLAMLYARACGLDERRMISLALTHDIGETKIGDLIWERGRIANTQKQQMKHKDEVAAVESIFAKIPLQDVEALVKEFLDQTTEEAKAMKEIDKIEMVVQALAYERSVEDPNALVEFWESAAKYIKTPFAWSLFDELKSRSAITVPLPTRPSP